MLTLFWNKQGVILEHYMPRGEPCDQYNVCRSPKESPVSCNQVQTTWTSEYRCFAPWQCSVPYCPLNCCNNPRLSFECLPHPLYSPDLNTSDFHVFGPLKEAMGCKSSRSDEEVQQAVHKWLHSQPKEFFLEVYVHFRRAVTLVWNAMETK